nr:CD209 antigen-like protein E [Lytechinus pictus]
MAFKNIFVVLFVGTIIQFVADAQECSLRESVGALLESCSALTATQCPDGWERSKKTGSCYYYLQEEMSWNNARTDCRNMGGELASLTNREEIGFVQDYILSIIGSASWKNVWIGIIRDGNKWRWLDGSELAIPAKAFWYPGEPNNASGGENIGELYASGLINDESQTKKTRPAICEMTM